MFEITHESKSFTVPVHDLPVSLLIKPAISNYAVVCGGICLIVVPVILFAKGVILKQISFFPWCFVLCFYVFLGLILIRDSLKKIFRKTVIIISSDSVSFETRERSEKPVISKIPMKQFQGVRFRKSHYFSTQSGSHNTLYLELVHKDPEKTICLKKLYFTGVGPKGADAEFIRDKKNFASFLNVAELMDVL